MEKIDIEKLISEVRERPIVWDTSSELYKDRLKKRNTWSEICVSLDKSLLDKSKYQQLIIRNMILQRWGSVRDMYLKYKKKEKEREKSGSQRPHRYRYANQLGFLDKVYLIKDSEERTVENTFKSSSATGSVTCNSEYRKKHNSEIENSSIKEDEELMQKRIQEDDDDEDMLSQITSAISNSINDPEELTVENTFKSSSATSSVTHKANYRKKHKSQIENPSYMKQARELMQKRIQEDNDDEDMSFFKSILSTVKKLNPNQNMQFRIHTMSYLQGISAAQRATMYHNYQQTSPQQIHFQPSPLFSEAVQANPYHHQRPSRTSTSHNQQLSSSESAPSASPVASNLSSPSIIHQNCDNDFS